MNVPPINIVMTYRPEIMMAFQEAESFTAFLKEKDRLEKEDKDLNKRAHTYIFNNTPNSTFISLKHNFNLTDGPSLELEIMDPQGIFEEAMLDNAGNVDDWSALESDPYANSLQQLADDLLYTKKQVGKQLLALTPKTLSTKPGGSVTKLSPKIDQVLELERRISTIKKESITTSSMEKIELARLTAMQEAIIPQILRPVYLAYGVGDELRYWSPPQCYKNIFRLGYGFDGKGVRILKLFLVGLGAHPNLIPEGGISPFGKVFKKGLLTYGASDPLFRKDVDDYNPSLHRAVTEAITNFIKVGADENNVYVLLPDLDKFLGKYLEDKRDIAKEAFKINRHPDDIEAVMTNLSGEEERVIINFLTFKSALEGLGLTLSEVADSKNSDSYLPVGPITCLNLEKDALSRTAFDAHMAWFEGRQFKAVIQCDYLDNISFLDKLKSVRDAIQANLQKEPRKIKKQKYVPYLLTHPQSETDMSILKVIKEHILGDFNVIKPLILWGDSGVITDYLYARSYEEWNSPRRTNATPLYTDKIEDVISPIDIEKGLNTNYMNAVLDSIVLSGGNGPFGPITAYHNGDQIPIFTFGYENPNILDLDIDFDAIYTAAITMAKPSTINSQQATTGIQKTGSSTQAKNLTKELKKLADGTDWFDDATATPNKVPNEFVKYIKNLKDKASIHDDLSDKTRLQKRFIKYGHTGLGWRDEKAHSRKPFFIRWSLDVFEGASIIYNKYLNPPDEAFNPELDAGWVKMVWLLYCRDYKARKIKGKGGTTKSFAGKSPVISSLLNSKAISKNISNQLIKVLITTVPLFHLSTLRRTLWRLCYVICKEPQIAQSDNKNKVTWFTGEYNIVGFSHTITSTNATSDFYMLKGEKPTKDELSVRNDFERDIYKNPYEYVAARRRAKKDKNDS